jgi:hypothetical protein
MRTFTLLMMLGCSEGGTNINSPDMATAMCTKSGAEVCDGVDNDCNGKIDELTASTANKAQFVGSQMPKMRTDYAIDLNGDGKLDNQLSALVGVLKSQGTDANVQIQNGILNGDQILLIDQMSADTGFKTDNCASADAFTGVAQPNPNLMGGGHFTVDTAVPSGKFTGSLAAGVFDSVLPPRQTTPVTLTLNLVMFPNRTIALPLVGAHITIIRETGKISGEIHGAIKKEDVQANILPTFAAQVQEQVTTKPNDPNSQALLGFFDDGGTPDPDAACMMTCRNTDGSCATAGDGKIDACEVTSNGIVQGVVASDVQMFTDDGTKYQPNPKNTHKDSLSLGVHFELVTASF